MSIVLTVCGYLFIYSVGVLIVAFFALAAIGRFRDWRDSRKPQPIPAPAVQPPAHTAHDCQACQVRNDLADVERIWSLS